MARPVLGFLKKWDQFHILLLHKYRKSWYISPSISNQHNQINYTYSGKELYSQYTNKYKFIKYTIYKKIYINSLNAQIQILREMLSRDNLYNWQKHINSSWCKNKKKRRRLHLYITASWKQAPGKYFQPFQWISIFHTP